MKKYHRNINFTSATTSMDECIKAVIHKNDKLDYIQMYHEQIKEILGVKYAWSFAGGRMALYVILDSLGIGDGDEVIIPGYTCCAVPKAVMYVGAKPVYADITKDDYNLSYESVESHITGKTRAIIVQHTYGIPCHAMGRIRQLCDQKHIYMIEDCAHTLGIKYNECFMGTIGDAAFFSTDHTKYISTSVGGIAITNNDLIAKKIFQKYSEIPDLTRKEQNAVVVQFVLMNICKNKYIAWFLNLNKLTRKLERYVWKILKKLNLTYYMDDYRNIDYPVYTFPARLSNVQALVGISQLKKLQENIKCREKYTCLYKHRLGDRYYIPNDSIAVLRLPIMVKDPIQVEKMLKDLVRVERWFTPAIECILEEDYDKFGYKKEDCPVAQYVSEHIINLPVHFKITEEEVEEICDRILAIT